MKDDNCIFCKIANGDIPSNVLYEDDMFTVIFDLAPASKGHALILPKEHAKDITQLDDEIVSEALVLAKRLTKVMKDEFKCDGINIVQNNGEEAGQTVFHFHMHLIPRYAGEAKIVTWNQNEANEDELKEMALKIRRAMK